MSHRIKTPNRDSLIRDHESCLSSKFDVTALTFEPGVWVLENECKFVDLRKRSVNGDDSFTRNNLSGKLQNLGQIARELANISHT